MIERLLGKVDVDVEGDVDINIEVDVDYDVDDDGDVDVDYDVDDDVDDRETGGKWEGAVNHCWWLWGKFTTPIIVIILSLQIMGYIVLTIFCIEYIQAMCRLQYMGTCKYM